MEPHFRSANQKFKSILRKVQRAHQPNFIIIGAQKAGTSSLHHYLNQHPNLVGSIPKEIHYFNREIDFNQNINWYESHFKSLRSNNKLFFESTPAYIYYPGTAKRINKYYPEIKLILILRNPIARAYSAWNHFRIIFELGLGEKSIRKINKRKGNLLYEYFFKGRDEFPSFRECINMELKLIGNNQIFEPSLLRRGLYLEQIKEYWQYFRKENILILGFSDLIYHFEACLSKITNFLDIKSIDWNNIDYTPKNSRKYKPTIKDEDKKFLENFYATPNQKLFKEIDQILW